MALILIADDEADLAELVCFHAKQRRHEAISVGTGGEAIRQTLARRPDLLVLDVMLPDLSGREVCRAIRADPVAGNTPVLMLTARGDVSERIEGLEAGADDYMSKPFSPRELMLRIDALLRRTGVRSAEVLAWGPLRLEPNTHRAFVEGEEVTLTALEFRLLLEFLRQPGHVLTRAHLLASVWGTTAQLNTRTVDMHVLRLREKLLGARDLLETVRGVGYRLRDAGARAVS